MQLTSLTVKDDSWNRFLKTGQRIFVLHCSFCDRQVPKDAGFRWNPEKKKWWTEEELKAAKLAEWADWSCRADLETIRLKNLRRTEMSRAASVDADFPKPQGLEYLPYQKAGIHFALQSGNVLIADEMGLGKTIQAIGIINSDPTIKTVLVICPASLKQNWRREMIKWLVNRHAIGIADGKMCPSPEMGFDITIINYDVLHKHPVLSRVQWDMVIADESHNIKNPKTIRAKHILGRKSEDIPGIRGKRIVALTGTPILNRPGEILSTLLWLDPGRWKGKEYYFVCRFCGGKMKGCNKHRMPELQEKLRSTIMIRRQKADVLKELPAKMRQVISLEVNDSETKELLRREKELAGKRDYSDIRAKIELAKASDNDEEYQRAIEKLKATVGGDIGELSRIRKEVAISKVPYVIDHLKNAIDSAGKVVAFAHHHEVLKALHAAFQGSVLLYGGTKNEDRQKAVDRFQSDPECTLFVGSIKAAGVGITLTASSTVVFAELDWVPGNLSQAEDRCHRIGQKDSVLVQHIVLDESLDARMAQMVVEKQKIIDAALDDNVEVEPVVPVPEKEQPATTNVRRDQIEKQAESITIEQCEEILTGLKMLAGMCDGARRRDGSGFSMVDAKIGHSLAQQYCLSPKQAVLGRRLLKKYKRQLPEELLEAVS